MALRSGDPSLLPSTLVGKPVPKTTFPPVEGLETAPGKTEPGFASDDLAKGKISVVNFWASWCVPCIDEHPMLEQLKEATGVDIYGVNYKDQPAAARRYLGRYGNPFTAVGTDTDGRRAIDWGVYGTPETFVINGKGDVIFKNVGPITTDTMKNKLVPLINKAKAEAAANPSS